MAPAARLSFFGRRGGARFAGVIPAVNSRRAEIAAVCRRFHVSRLDLFGSAARGGDFDPARSDVDLLVQYLPGHAPPALADFLALREALESVLGHQVDLAMESGIRNPFVRAAIERSRAELYAA
jgi:predicted nucleotidyltransferase